jgi:hypothetical protein
MTKNQKIGIAAVIIILILVGIGIAVYQNKQTQQMINDMTGNIIESTQNQPTETLEPTKPTSKISPTPLNIAKDPQNATYTIEGQKVTLIDGSSQDGSTTIFDTPAVGDLNGDGANDAGVILVVTGNGSGTFYYAAAALNNTTDFIYEGTNAIILGDRIAPQTKSIQDEIYTVNYADRAEGDPMTTQPSIGVSKYFEVNNSTLVETEQ